MNLVKSPLKMQQYAQSCKREGKSIALVPTMGALHEGHRQLMQEARKLADVLIVSIYVNPTQFGPSEDFSRYPRTPEVDEAFCKEAGVDVIFSPDSLYEADASTWVEEKTCSEGRCGATRPGHFLGVTTVVAMLFNICLPDIAVFGQKDAQQCEVIERMVRDLFMPLRIVVAPIVRESDGLAISSRNRYLTPEERAQAPQLNRTLLRAAKLPAAEAEQCAREELTQQGFRVDYVTAVNHRLCAAAFLGKTRLIDNVPLSN